MTTFEHTDMYAKKNLSLYCIAQVSQTSEMSNPQYQKSVENLQNQMTDSYIKPTLSRNGLTTEY